MRLPGERTDTCGVSFARKWEAAHLGSYVALHFLSLLSVASCIFNVEVTVSVLVQDIVFNVKVTDSIAVLDQCHFLRSQSVITD